MTKPDLVILTTHFGTNFSGGSTATCEIFSRIEPHFESITVVGTELGEYPFEKLRFIKYRSYRHLVGILGTIDVDRTVFYGDFFNSIFYTILGLPFYFTYHDNWPELGTLSLAYGLKGRIYWALYRKIFKSATHVFVVSKHKMSQVEEYTSAVSLVRNGASASPGKSVGRHIRENVLMVGTIDHRKYAKSVELFELLAKTPDIRNLDLRVDIYGRNIDLRLVEKLKRFHFVNLCGHVKHVPYHRYRLLLHTSLMENLSLVWCEAVLNGTPVVTFDIGGAKEVVTAGRGMLVRPYDIELMLRAIKTLLVNPVLVDGSGVADDFSWDTAAQRYQQRMLNVN